MNPQQTKEAESFEIGTGRMKISTVKGRIEAALGELLQALDHPLAKNPGDLNDNIRFAIRYLSVSDANFEANSVNVDESRRKLKQWLDENEAMRVEQMNETERHAEQSREKIDLDRWRDHDRRTEKVLADLRAMHEQIQRDETEKKRRDKWIGALLAGLCVLFGFLLGYVVG